MILVADDDALVRLICQRTLLEVGFRVVLATDGGEALAAFNAHRAQFAAVVLDRTMPVLTGEQVLAQMAPDHKSLGRRSHTDGKFPIFS
jgi:CheY-like chemotaxis protein